LSRPGRRARAAGGVSWGFQFVLILNKTAPLFNSYKVRPLLLRRSQFVAITLDIRTLRAAHAGPAGLSCSRKMIICSCNAISDTSVKASIRSEKSPRTPGAVYRCLGCRPNCGRCFETVRTIIDDALKQAGTGEHVHLSAAKDQDWAIAARAHDHHHPHDHRHDHHHGHGRRSAPAAHEASGCEKNCDACAAAAAPTFS
jgi:bacterioferritin-associated ferredoxin